MADIIYDFRFDTGRELEITVALGEDPATSVHPDDLPEWTRLAFHKCPNCPLPDDPCSHCPVALRTLDITKDFSEVISHERARVTVRAFDRKIMRRTDMNTALRSLMGLCMALSECPIMGRLRPMALHHLPFASIEETVGRVVRHYLFKQYFVMRDGGAPDWNLDGLRELYLELKEATTAFLERIRAVSHKDANLNALVGLIGFSTLYSSSLDELLELQKKQATAGF